LAWNCTCSNGNQPNISNYEQTIPGQVCLKWVENCVLAHPDDLDGIGGCRSVICGTQTVRNAATTSKPATTSTTSDGGSNTPTGAATTTPASTATTSTRPNAAATLAAAQNYGHIAIAGGMAALLGLAL
jgi:hypothetical protein